MLHGRSSALRRLAAGLLIVGSVAPSSWAAETGEPWRLGDAARAPEWLTLSGSFRARYESLANQYRAGMNGGDQVVSLRTVLFAEARGETFRFGFELQDSRGYGSDEGGGVTNADVNVSEPIQAYVAAGFDGLLGGGSSTDILVGRFKHELGSQRLMGVNNFRNTTNAFTGVKVEQTFADSSALTAFYALPHTRLPSDQERVLDNDLELDEETSELQFWGLFYTRAGAGLPFGGSGEVFVLGLNEEDGVFQTRNRGLVTPGARVFRNPAAGAWDYELEGGWQFGEARGSTSSADVTDLDVAAYYAHLEVGRSFDGPWAARVALEYDFGSGDESPTDDEINRFDALYGPRRFDFGPTGIFGALSRNNLSSPGVRVEVKPNARWDGFVHGRALWLDSRTDSFAATGVRDATGASGDFAGHQIEARARYWIAPDSVRFELGGATLIADEFLANAPNATGEGATLYGYADLTWTF